MVFPHLALNSVNRSAATLDGVAGKSINVAKVLKLLGERPLAVGFQGGLRGEELQSVLRERQIAFDFATVSTPTRLCVTVIDQSAGTHTELVEESRSVAPGDYEQLMTIIRRQVKRCRAVVMSGTLTPGGPEDFYRRCVELAHDADALSVVDARQRPLLEALQAGPGLVKPNRRELEDTLGCKLDDEPAVRGAMVELARRGAQRVVVSAGKDTTLAFDGHTFWKIHPPRIAAANPIGSGDALTAGLVTGLLRGDGLGEACRWASAVGAANALTLMPGELNRKDVDRLLPAVGLERLDG